MPNLSTLLVWLLAYLIGAIPFGWLIARMRGVDIFAVGSGNIGATNVARALGKPLGILVFVLDFAKGAGPVLLARQLHEAVAGRPDLIEVGAGLAAFLGHLFPIYLRFRGGKGVATAAGVVTVLYPLPAIAGLAAFVSVASATRYVSLGSLAAAVTLVVMHLLQAGTVDLREPLTVFALVALVMVFVKHRGNIQRLGKGTEAKIGDHPIVSATARTLHVTSLGIWSGMSVFFTFVVAIALFQGFKELGEAKDRPAWFPLPPAFQAVEPVNGPEEQGSRAFGYAVGRIFPSYFHWQFFCGVVAMGTALGWPKMRPCLIGIALLGVIAGWAIERKVANFRPFRNEAMDAFLQADPVDREKLRTAMMSSRAEFGGWHVVNLFVNFGVVGLVVVAMLLSANLPFDGRASDGPRAAE